MNERETYHVVEVENGYAIERRRRIHKLVSVMCLVQGSVQFGRNDQPGAFCTRHLPESELYHEHSQRLLGVWPRRSLAEDVCRRMQA